MKNNTYLLLGPEEGEKANFIRKLLKSKEEELGEKPEIYRFYPFESDILDIVTLLKSSSLFASYKLVILYNIENIKKQNDLKLLEEYCTNPAQDATFILTSNQVRLNSKKLNSLVPAKNKVIFWELNESQKRGWVRNFFRQRNLKLDAATTDFLLEMVENNTRDLKRECNKLAGFFSPGTQLTEADLEKYLYHSKQENVFTLFDKIAERNFTAALEVLEKLLLSGEANSIGLMSGLLWQFRKVHQFKIMQQQNYNTAEAFQALAVRSKRSQKIYLLAQRKYSLHEIAATIVLINDYDIKFRSFRQELHSMLLQLFLYQVIIKGGQVPQLQESRWV